jgi:RNA polymerase sigma-70 factor (ECF subfamily)
VDFRVNQGHEQLESEDLQERFVELLTRHRAQVFYYIFCIVQTMADAEDVFQQTTMAMWSNFEQFTPGTDFVAWAIRIARFRALGFLRSKRRDRIVFSEELIEQLTGQALSESADIQDARLEALESCRKKLSPQDQQLLKLCYGGCGNIGDAAQQIERPLGAVYDSLSRIRRALFNCIRRTLAREEYV